MWGYTKNFYGGISLLQIFHATAFNKESVSNAGYKLNNHYFITTGYQFKVNPDLSIIPSVLIKAVNPAPISFDMNIKVKYQEMYWIGISYRNQESIAGIIGFAINNLIEVGYSYDYITSSKVKLFGSGSHEFMIGIKPTPKGRVRSPSDFW